MLLNIPLQGRYIRKGPRWRDEVHFQVNQLSCLESPPFPTPSISNSGSVPTALSQAQSNSASPLSPWNVSLGTLVVPNPVVLPHWMFLWLNISYQPIAAKMPPLEGDPPWPHCLKLTFLFLVYKVSLVNTLPIFLIAPFITWNSFSDIFCFSPPLNITLLYKGPFILYHHPPLSSVSDM